MDGRLNSSIKPRERAITALTRQGLRLERYLLILRMREQYGRYTLGLCSKPAQN